MCKWHTPALGHYHRYLSVLTQTQMHVQKLCRLVPKGGGTYDESRRSAEILTAAQRREGHGHCQTGKQAHRSAHPPQRATAASAPGEGPHPPGGGRQPPRLRVKEQRP